MSNAGLTRREVLSAAAAAMPLVWAGATEAKAAAQQPNPPAGAAPVIGISTQYFSAYSNSELAVELAKQGIKVVQLFLMQKDSTYWKYNSRSDLSDLSPDRCKAIGEAYRSAGIAIHSIGVYTNLIHPDEAERRSGLAYFEGMMKVGAAMDVRVFITEAGHYRGSEPEPLVPYHFQESTWKMMVGTAKELAQIADRYDATVLMEPFFRGFLATAKRTRLFIEEVNSPRIRALLDPANLLEVNDLEEMFQQLGPYIDCIHAKDRKLHVDKGVPAGQGDLDYPKFVALAAKHVPKAPLILEYVGPKDYLEAVAHLRKAMGA